MADDNVGGVDAQSIIRDDDAFAGSRFTRDSDVGVVEIQVRVQGDCTADVEHNRPRTVEGRGQAVPQGADARVVQRRDVVDVSSAPAGDEAPFALGAGKGRKLSVNGRYDQAPRPEACEREPFSEASGRHLEASPRKRSDG